MSRRKGAPWKHRPTHRAFYRLSSAARQRAVDGFRRNEATTAIVTAIAKDHGEKIPGSSLNRYREWWDTTERPVVESAKTVEELLAAFKDHPTPEMESVVRQLLMAQRLTAMAEDKKPDPVKLGFLDLEERRLRLKEREVALRERELERRVNKAAGVVERELKKRDLDPETIKRIKQEVYGLAS
jgi:Protein of unknown function (DUF3486)